jgi:hypothetical protein
MTQAAWSKAVRERDGWVCFICGSKERLAAHHILPARTWPECKFDMENGISLCGRHHTMGKESIHRGSGSLLVFLKLQKERPEQFAYLVSKIFP